MRKTVLLLALLAGCSKEDSSASADPNAPEKIKVISTGQAYGPSDYLVPGYVTILDFTADWCGPCQRLAPELDKLIARKPKVLLRKVDIVNWDSDAWKQASGEYKARGIPLLAIYDGKGGFHGTVPGQPPLIEAAVNKALEQ